MSETTIENVEKVAPHLKERYNSEIKGPAQGGVLLRERHADPRPGQGRGQHGCGRGRPRLQADRGRDPRPHRHHRPEAGGGPDERAHPHDPHPEQRRHQRRAGVREPPGGVPSGGSSRCTPPARAGAGTASPPGAAPDWMAVETAPLPDLIEAIRPGGLAVSKSPRIQAALRLIREERGDHSLEFLADMPPLEARDWLSASTGSARRPPRCCSCSASACRSSRSIGMWSESPGASAYPAEGDGRRRPRPLPWPRPARAGARGPREPHPARAARVSRPTPRSRALPARAALPVRRSEGSLIGRMALPILGSC